MLKFSLAFVRNVGLEESLKDIFLIVFEADSKE